MVPQVRVAKPYISCPIPECSGYLEEGVVVSHLATEDVAKYRYFLELNKLDSSTKPCPQCSEFTTLNKHNAHHSEHKYKVGTDTHSVRLHNPRQFLWGSSFSVSAVDSVQQLPVCMVFQMPRPLAQRSQMPWIQERRQAATNLGQCNRTWTKERPEVSSVQGKNRQCLSISSRHGHCWLLLQCNVGVGKWKGLTDGALNQCRWINRWR